MKTVELPGGRRPLTDVDLEVAIIKARKAFWDLGLPVPNGFSFPPDAWMTIRGVLSPTVSINPDGTFDHGKTRFTCR